MVKSKAIRYLIEFAILVAVFVYYWTNWRPRSPSDYPGGWIGTAGPSEREVRALIQPAGADYIIAGSVVEPGKNGIACYFPKSLDWIAAAGATPKSHTIIDFAELPNKLIALSFASESEPGGILFSNDKGKSWSFGSHLPGNADPKCIAVDKNGVIYTGSVGAGIYKSTDGAATWSEISGGVKNKYIQTIACDPFIKERVYAGTSQGIYVMDNGGGDWRLLERGFSAKDLFFVKILVNSSRKGALYAIAKSTSGAAFFYVSTNHGRSWKLRLDGLPEGIQPRAVAYNSSSPRTLFLGTVHDGVFRSDDEGRYWSAMNRDFPLKKKYFIVHCLLYDSESKTLFAGTDLNGAVWTYR